MGLLKVALRGTLWAWKSLGCVGRVGEIADD
jgi:hypothetical protein